MKKSAKNVDDILKFDFRKIPEDTRLVHAIDYKQINGTALDVDFVSNPNEAFEAMKALAWKMIKTCDVDGGVGFALPQYGISKKAFVMVGFDDPFYWQFNGSFTLIMNPTLKPVEGTEIVTDIEGCLSVPGKQLPISRPREINVSYFSFDESGNVKNYVDRLTGYPSRIFQHENQHLFGGNIVDLHERQNAGKRQKKRTR
jgi:peptide deformylase